MASLYDESMASLSGPPPPANATSIPGRDSLQPGWRFSRLGPVSGRYRGVLTGGPSSALECRIDIDPRSAASPVTDRISGDLYDVFSIRIPGREPTSWEVYRESWIVDAPQVTWARTSVMITGRVRFWAAAHPDTDVRVVIPWGSFRPAGPAEVTFTEDTGATQTYLCQRASTSFRDLSLEIDVCQSVKDSPQPIYDTHAHPNHPPDIPQRALTIEQAYEDAGIGLSFNRLARSEIDDRAPQFQSWSAAELHDAMESTFIDFGEAWPRWSMWALLAGQFDDPKTAGIMFDAAASFGGAGEAPDRQGFAAFRNHPWFKDLPAGAPADPAQAAASRLYLYTWVHEAGHAFNFLHSWNKGRPLALSWMNYPQRYDNLTEPDQFWSEFEFQFDAEELIHIRHGNRAAVIMGGDPWASGGHLRAPSAALADLTGDAPLELKLRADPNAFDLMERVTIDVRLRNLLKDLPLTVDTHLDPAYGAVAYFIRRPDGSVVRHAPIACQLGLPDLRTLEPEAAAKTGKDRHSAEVDLTYGATGFVFDHAGEYQIRALYQGRGDIMVPSNVLTIRVLPPLSRAAQLQTPTFFSDQVGLAIALGGSASPHLQEGMQTLEQMAKKYKKELVGARAAEIVATTASAAFFRIKGQKKVKVEQVKEADPDKATEYTELALNNYRQEAKPRLNLAHNRLVRQHATLLAEHSRLDEAKQELAALRESLEEREVRPAVLEEIQTFEKQLGRPQTSSKQ